MTLEFTRPVLLGADFTNAHGDPFLGSACVT